MKVLSLFDGIACCRIALDRAGIPVERYYAAELDKHAMKVSSANYPDIIHLGDVTKVNIDELPMIDLLVFGSPCQGFSMAGKQLNFDDPRSRLFFTAADIKDKLQAVNPKLWFLMENVRMEKWCERIITERLDVDPVLLDSALVSAQRRNRLYWSNMPIVGNPKDRQIFLKDILEDEVDDKYYLSEKTIAAFQKHADRNKENGNGFGWNIRTVVDKSAAIPTGSFKSTSTFVESGRDKAVAVLASGGEDKMANFVEIRHPVIAASRGRGEGWQQHGGEQRQYRGKSQTMTARLGTGGDNIPYVIAPQTNIRRLTEIEVERLQTVPDNYTNHISSSQRYKCLGNGMTVDMIAWIFSFMRGEPKNGIAQKGLFD